MIDSFRGEYHFLSNFYMHPISLSGINFPSAEHAFQAHKTFDRRMRAAIADAPTPNDAKRIGRTLRLRSDWNEVRLDVMHYVLQNKFADGTEMARQLLSTGKHILVEGNTWGDVYWGVYNGEGSNWLGKLLMLQRAMLRGH